MTAAEHHGPPSVMVGMTGVRVVCPCGWASHRKVEESTATLQTALGWWYDHYIGKVRAENRQRPSREDNHGPAVAERDGDPRRSV